MGEFVKRLRSSLRVSGFDLWVVFVVVLLLAVNVLLDKGPSEAVGSLVCWGAVLILPAYALRKGWHKRRDG